MPTGAPRRRDRSPGSLHSRSTSSSVAPAGPCGGSGAWPLLWVPIAIVLVFLTVSWLGLWLDTPPLARAVGLALFAAALGLSLWPVLRLAPAGPPAAPSTGSTATPASARPGPHPRRHARAGRAIPGRRALWDLHRRRAEAAIDKLRCRRPAAGHAEARPLRPARGGRCWPSSRAPSSPGRNSGSRLAAAFDWREPAQAAAPCLPGRRLDRPAALYPHRRR